MGFFSWLWGERKFPWPGSSRAPRLTGGVTGLPLGYCCHTHQLQAITDSVTLHRAQPRALSGDRDQVDFGPEDRWVRTGPSCSHPPGAGRTKPVQTLLLPQEHLQQLLQPGPRCFYRAFMKTTQSPELSHWKSPLLSVPPRRNLHQKMPI